MLEPTPVPDLAVPTERIPLLVADAELAAAVPDAARPTAQRLVVVPSLTLDAGAWTPDLRGANDDEAFGLLVLEGRILREVCVGDRRSGALFGAGDVLRPSDPSESMVPHRVEWTVVEPGTVAVLDDVFVTAARRWPGLTACVGARLAQQADRLALHLAISQLPRVEQRVVALLWFLSDRWGRVTPEGVVVPIRLTHEALGRLIGAQRPTVSLALSALDEAGSVRRTPRGGWLLHHDSAAPLAGMPARTPRRPAAQDAA